MKNLELNQMEVVEGGDGCNMSTIGPAIVAVGAAAFTIAFPPCSRSCLNIRRFSGLGVG